jgi:hypothetical protein
MFGCPYLWKEGATTYKFTTKKPMTDELYTEIKELVEGMIELHTQAVGNTLIVHPMFRQSENKSWEYLHELLITDPKQSKIQIYSNEEGAYKCSPNMGLICLQRDYSSLSGLVSYEMVKKLPIKANPYFGQVCLLVPVDILSKYDFPLKPYEEEDDDDDDDE